LALLGCAGVIAVAFTSPAFGGRDEPDPTYLAELTAAADAGALADEPQWRALLHYRRRVGTGVVSAADSEWFFQAPDGRSDPRAELHATLARFFATAARLRDGEPAQCALRARYLWLGARLQFDPARLPPQPCTEYDAWRAGLAATGVTLIFPEAFMNNPSSMFGHTLLRIDAGAPGERQALLAYGVNFSADTGDDGGIAFAWKGILGYYPGRFGIEPYYDIITRYGDWENRDIWEYELSLSPAEIDLLLAHLWELRGAEFDYYFFDENCSYQLLALLEAARPSLALTDGFSGAVIPADTVRSVVAAPGLVGGATFRPSNATVLRHAARALPRAHRQLANQIADGETGADDPRLTALRPSAQAAVLGTAYELFRHRYSSRRPTTPAEQHRARQMLLARSQVPHEGSALPPVAAPAVRPDLGHRSNRVVAGAGVRDGRFYLEAGFRPAYHDLLDPVGGYTAGAQIDFLDLTLRYYTKERDPRVHRFTLVDIVSIAAVDAFFFPVSWTVGTGMFSRLIPDQDDDLEERYVWRSQGGAGLAIEPVPGSLAYAFADATVDYSPALEEDHAIGPGARAGFFFFPADDRWRGHLFAAVTGFVLGDTSTAVQGGLDGRVLLTAQTALRVGVSGHADFEQSWIEGGAAWEAYF
jgi:hypothetical protein